MLYRRILNRLPNYYCFCQNISVKRYCDSKNNPSSQQEENVKPNLKLGDIGSKYQVFRDEDSTIVIDVVEERLKYASMLEAQELEVHDPFEGLNLERGVTGVFDVEDLVTVLNRENAKDLFVAAVPSEFQYVNHICVVSGKSYRHMLAIAQFVRRVFKQKRHSSDSIPRLEGQYSKDWMAIDLGNIALHIFSTEARSVYDIDSLWAVGPQYDKEVKKEDPIAQMLEKHTIYLKDLQPAS